MVMSLDEIERYYAEHPFGDGKPAGTPCACNHAAVPDAIAEIREQLPEEVREGFRGHGAPLPPALDGCTVLVLGCGTGRDAFVAAKLAGATGKVIGIDWRDDQIGIAEKHHAEVAHAWGFDNIEFKKGYLEALSKAGIEDESIDVVVSSRVVNQSPCKEAVFSEIWRVLKIGGELYFNNAFVDRRVPQHVSDELLKLGKCLGGAMYMEDFRRLMTKCGWADFRYMESTAINPADKAVAALVGNAQYSSRTIRAFKLPDTVEDICEQYGQTAIYRGGIVGCENYFDLDDHHRFFKDLRLDVCGNSCTYVQDTRYGKHFEIFGDRSQHFGPYSGCGNAPAVKR